jgi:hypothetical protein
MPAASLEWRQRIYFVVMVLLAGAGSDARRRLVEFIKTAFDKSGG